MNAAIPFDTSVREMPKLVKVSLVSQMLLVPAVLAFILFLYQPALYPETNDSFFALGVATVASLVFLGIILLLARGYGRLRHFLAVAAGLRIPRQTLLVLQLLQVSHIAATALVAINLWWLFAIGMLYAPSAQRWFRQLDAQRDLASNQSATRAE